MTVGKATEQHFRPEELAKLWRKSPTTIREWFRNEPGVLRHGTKVSRPGKKRAYVTMTIPISVAERVHTRMSA